MIWGCIFEGGPRYVIRIDGKMDIVLFVSILDNEQEQSRCYYSKNLEDAPFYQDNDPKYKSKRPWTGS